MDRAIDILDDENGDLMIKYGDIVFGDSSLQHVNDLILASKGHYKQSPETGIGISNYFNDDINVKELQAEIQKQIEQDGGEIDELKVNSFMDINITITATYEG